MERVRRGHLDAPDLDRAALLDRDCILHALALQVGEDLEVGDRRSTRLSQERQHVREVVEVAVGDEHGVQLAHPLQVVRRLGVVCEKGVYDDLLAPGGSEPEGRVTEVGDPGSAQHALHCLPPSSMSAARRSTPCSRAPFRQPYTGHGISGLSVLHHRLSPVLFGLYTAWYPPHRI